jgi:hypothetical protein
VFKDDRMMSVLTFLVVMVAVGTVVQRADLLDRLFGGGTPVVLQRDQVVVPANAATRIDVLANDEGLKPGDAEDLVVARRPACGQVTVKEGQLEYLPAERCVGSQSFAYRLLGHGEQKLGEVVAQVRSANPKLAAGAQRGRPAGAPQAADRRAGAPQGRQRDAVAGASRPGAAARPETQTGTRADARPPGTGAVAGGSAAPAPPGARQRENLPARAGAAATASGGGAVPTAQQPGRPAPQQRAATDGPGGTIALATAEPQQRPATAPPATGRPETMPLEHPPAEIGTGASAHTEPGGGQHPDALAAIRRLHTGSDLGLVDTTPPAPLGAGPPASPEAGPGAGPGASRGTAPEAGRSRRTASLPSSTAACTIPPALTLDVKPAAITQVIIEAPCQAGTVAELSYDGLRFGIALDRNGDGTIGAIGLQPSSEATLRFADGKGHKFNIPFSDTDRMDRVVLTWDMPVTLNLHAFEFGARGDSDSHVRPDHPRSFAEVRRHGGGYLLEYDPVRSKGQRIEAYTFWRRHAGPSGVVKLKLDYADRDDGASPDTCGTGAHAAPGFTVLRSMAGVLQRPRHRSLAPLDCTAVAAMEDRYIGDAVADLIVPRD